MDLKDSITKVFGRERAALCETEIQQLAEDNYSESDLKDFLETYATPAGVFYALSMFKRSKMDLKGLREAVNFLFNPAPTIIRILQARLPLESRILDFGCGRGHVTCALALEGFHAFGVDISRDALKIARKLAVNLNCQSAFHLVRKNKIPFPNEYFDAALSFWVFHEVQRNRLPLVIEELHRTVREDGLALVIDQESVARFENIKSLMAQHGFELHSDEVLSPVYDHGKASHALMQLFVRK